MELIRSASGPCRYILIQTCTISHYGGCGLTGCARASYARAHGSWAWPDFEKKGSRVSSLYPVLFWRQNIGGSNQIAVFQMDHRHPLTINRITSLRASSASAALLARVQCTLPVPRACSVVDSSLVLRNSS